MQLQTMRYVFIILFAISLLATQASGQHFNFRTPHGTATNNSIILNRNSTQGTSFILDTTSYCSQLYTIGKDYSYSNKPSYLRMGYDTLRFFIESCATKPNV